MGQRNNIRVSDLIAEQRIEAQGHVIGMPDERLLAIYEAEVRKVEEGSPFADEWMVALIERELDGRAMSNDGRN